MTTEEAIDSLYAVLQKKAENYCMVEGSKIGRKGSRPNYGHLPVRSL